MRKSIIQFLSVAFLLSGCDERETGQNFQVIERDKVEFVTLNSNIRFRGQAFAKGDRFELIRLENGMSGVMLHFTNTENPIATYGGLLQQSHLTGVLLDKNLCSTGGIVVSSDWLGIAGSPKEGQEIAIFDKYTLDDPSPMYDTHVKFCFTML